MIIHRSLAAGVGLAALATSAFAQSSTPTAEEIAALRALGVDMICSDTPDRVSVHRTVCR